jgi:hypothetical protein
MKFSLLALAACGFLYACSSLHVQPKRPLFRSQDLVRTSRDDIEFGWKAIVGEDEYLDLFDENLPESGLVAIWIQIRNGRAQEIDPNPHAWSLRIGNEKFPALSIAEVFKRYYSGSKIRMVTVNADRTARAEMEQLAFPRGRIPAGTAREGLLFFRIKSAFAAEWAGAATLCASEIQLAPHSRTRIEIVLFHAKS